MTFYDKVREVVVGTVANYPLIPMDDKQLFLGMLTVCYHSMVASEPMLKLAASLPGPHQEYFIRHEAEERGHEAWMLQDIAALGGEVGEPFPETVTMCGEMYYKIRHMNPAALLGYMAVIEGFPTPPEKIALLKSLYPEGCRTLEYHAENDVEHHKELAGEIVRVAPPLQALVLGTAKRTAEIYCDALWRLIFNLKGKS